MRLADQAAVKDGWLTDRLDTIVPALMAEYDIEAWIVMGREYNEDPVLRTMLPATWLSARRRTILLFLEHGQSRLAISRYDAGPFPGVWDPETQPDQWQALVERLIGANPASIAVNTSRRFALADGASAGELRALNGALPGPLMDRIVSGENLALGWLETRTAEEVAHHDAACRLAHSIIAEGFSDRTVEPGSTTTGELEWWFRQQVHDRGLSSWFHPTVSLQRRGGVAPSDFSTRPGDAVVRAGDLLHVDFGLVSLGLHTDQQQMAYVLTSGEAGPPAGLTEALSVGNRLQNILTAEFVTGRTGNEILSAARDTALREGIAPTIYTHPLGVHGHAAGPTIGLWDMQDGVPDAGDYPLRPNTSYAIELAAAVDVPEWDGQTVSIMLEEDAFFDGSTVRYLDGRQTQLHVIG